jgi:AraC-like DNA-binding protein
MVPRLLLPQNAIAPIRSLEEARLFYGKLNTPIKLESIDRATPFEWHMGVASLGAITISNNWYRSAVRGWAESSEDLFTVSIPTGPVGGEITHGGTVVSLRQGHTGYLGSPLLPTDARLGSGFQSIQLSLRRTTMSAAFEALSGIKMRAPLRFEPKIMLGSGAGASFLRLINYVVSEMSQREGLLTSPFLAQNFSDAILSYLIQDQPHNYTALLHAPTRAAEPQHVRLAAEYLEANATKPITITMLAALAGVSIRAIHAGFQKYRGCTPLEFLRERRLILARAELLSSHHATITEVATSCGFEHLGRFSILYRERFGETPSQTRRRASPSSYPDSEKRVITHAEMTKPRSSLLLQKR